MKSFRAPTTTHAIAGYAETRRHLLIAAPAAIGALMAAPNQLLAAVTEAETDVEVDAQLEQFIMASEQRALALKSDDSASGQDAYVHYLAGAVTAVDNAAQENLSTQSWQGLDPGVFLGESGRNRAFFVVHWKLAPGAFLPPHCHPKTSVCTLCLEGSSVLRNFEAESSAPSYRNDRTTEFLIRETKRIELRSGTRATLTEHRDNIHFFQAGNRGARGIDVTTDYGGDGSFSFLEFDHRRPVDSALNTFRARWIGTSLS